MSIVVYMISRLFSHILAISKINKSKDNARNWQNSRATLTSEETTAIITAEITGIRETAMPHPASETEPWATAVSATPIPGISTPNLP